MAYVKFYYPETLTFEYYSAFEAAAATWSNVIDGGLSPVTFDSVFNARDTACNVDYEFEAGETIEGLGIFAHVENSLSTKGMVAGGAPCSMENGFARLGVVYIDAPYISSIGTTEDVYYLIMQQVGHAVGIGSLWSQLGLITNACPTTQYPCQTNPTYNGPSGIEAWKALGGQGDLFLSDQGSPGSWNIKWNEIAFGTELMSEFLNIGESNPLSLLTVMALQDLDYNVNLDAAESYELPFSTRMDLGEHPVYSTILVLEENTDFEVSVESFAAEVAAAEEAANETDNSGFVAVILLMVFGFAMMMGLIGYEARNQRKAIEKLYTSVRNPAIANSNLKQEIL